MRICIIIFFLSLSITTQQIHAQSVAVATPTPSVIPVNGGAGGIPELEEKVYYTVLPEKPKLGDLVDIRAEMYGTPIQNAIFTWNVDGILYKKAQGLSKISVPIQKNTKVSVSIVTVKGVTLYKEWVFNPQNVIILWEANTYTHPLYKGKPLYTAESELVLKGINLDAKNPLTNTYANYVWKIDGTVQGSDSGVSRRTYTYKGDLLQLEPLFELLYTSITNFQDTEKKEAVNTRSILRVSTIPTEIFTYEKRPLLGILFNKGIKDVFTLQEKETSLTSYPMYFSAQSSSALNYLWSINSDAVKANSNTLSFKKIRDNEKSLLTVSIKNSKSLLQGREMEYVVDTTASPSNKIPVVGGFGN